MVLMHEEVDLRTKREKIKIFAALLLGPRASLMCIPVEVQSLDVAAVEGNEQLNPRRNTN